MSDYHIYIFYSEEDGGYIADTPDLEACSACDATQATAFNDRFHFPTGWIER